MLSEKCLLFFFSPILKMYLRSPFHNCARLHTFGLDRLTQISAYRSEAFSSGRSKSSGGLVLQIEIVPPQNCDQFEWEIYARLANVE
jgi:hypothetical protein